MGSGTNAERMNRQAAYIRSVIDRMRQKLSEETGFAADLISSFRSIAVTELTDQRLLEEISRARAYEVLPVDRLPGRYTQDESGFIEFYPDEDSATEWIMNHLYSVR